MVRRGAVACVAFVVACATGADLAEPTSGGADASAGASGAGGSTSGGGGSGVGGTPVGGTGGIASGGSGGSSGGAGGAASGGAGSGGSGPSGGSAGAGGIGGSGADGGSSTGGAAGGTGGSGGNTSNPPDSDCRGATYAGHDYWFCTNNRDWDAARERCVAAGGDLVSINDANEQAFVDANISSDSWLIGLNKKNASGMSTDGTWEWVDGTSPVVYEHWNSGEPDSYDCGGMSSSGMWSDFTCSNDENWICEVPGS
jgi:hypothetical protein